MTNWYDRKEGLKIRAAAALIVWVSGKSGSLASLGFWQVCVSGKSGPWEVVSLRKVLATAP